MRGFWSRPSTRRPASPCRGRILIYRSASRFSHSRRSLFWSTPTVARRVNTNHSTIRYSSRFSLISLLARSTITKRSCRSSTSKKMLFADVVAQYATPIFNAAAAGQAGGLVNGWIGACGFALQLYYDFSGYTDMAIGLALMIGVRLPLNFDSPYKALSLVDFWRRWHMTLSRFLRDYLYIPLGGNRRGPRRRYVNLLVTMLL